MKKLENMQKKCEKSCTVNLLVEIKTQRNNGFIECDKNTKKIKKDVDKYLLK